MAKLAFNEAEAAKMATADELEARAKALRQEASKARDARTAERPLLERLVFAADARCPCGAGLAYDPVGESGGIRGYWDCSAILLGEAEGGATHTDRLPFTFWEVKSENQPSVCGRRLGRSPSPPSPATYTAGSDHGQSQRASVLRRPPDRAGADRRLDGDAARLMSWRYKALCAANLVATGLLAYGLTIGNW